MKRVVNQIKKSVIGQTTVIARGTPKEEGIEGVYECSFDFIEDSKLKEPRIRPIRAGQQIVLYQKSVKGKPGIMVNGELDQPIVVEEKPCPIGGRNTQTLEEDGKVLLIAMAHGHVQKVGDTYSVLTAFVYNANLTEECGTVNFRGDFVVNGNVEAGAVLHASGNVIIAGTMDANAVVTAGGTIKIGKP